MNVQKITTITFSLVFTLFLFSITFLFSDWEESFIKIENNYLWYEEVWIQDDEYLFSKIEDFSKEEFIVDNISLINKSYFILKENWNYSVDETDKTIEINIDKWIFIFDIDDISQDYNIINNDFKIKPKSPWKFLVDARDPLAIKILSFESILDYRILNKDSEIRKIYVYPKMLLSYNSKAIKMSKSSNFLIMPFLNIDFSLNWNSINEILDELKLNSDDTANNLLKILAVIDKKQKNNSISKLLDVKNKNIYWLNFINKYFFSFLNDEKKLIYYKKNIVKLLLSFNFEKKSTKQDEILSKIEESLNWIKDLDEDVYNEMFTLLVSFYDVLLKAPDISYLDKSIKFLSFLQKNFDYSNSWKFEHSYFYISKVMDLLNSWNFKNKDFKDSLNNFLNYYFEKNDIEDWNLFDSDKVKNQNFLTDSHISEIQYKLFFLENILTSESINFFDKDWLDSMLSILDTYIKTNRSINDYLKANSQENYSKLTEALEISFFDVSNSIFTNLKDTFFLDEVDEFWLLQTSENKNKVSSMQLDSTKHILDNIMDFTINNTSNLSSQKRKYHWKIIILDREYEKYISALTDFEMYKNEYWKLNKKLTETKTISQLTPIEEINKDDVEEYLGTFNWLSTSFLDITPYWDWIFKVDSLYVLWGVMSFDINTSLKNKINNIIYKWEEISDIFKLDDIEEQYKELFETAEEDERDKYDFKNFFVNIFWEKEEEKEIIIIEEVKKESPTVIAFKREKLFSERWEFPVILDFLWLNNNNVFIELIWTNYDISIDEAQFKMLIPLDTPISVIWKLSSKYLFSSDNHHFSKPVITLYNAETSGEEEIVLFNESTFKLDYDIHILELEEEITQALTKFYKLLPEYSNIVWRNEKAEIIFSETGVIKVKVERNWKIKTALLK